jgi:hypothetical protein
MASIGAAIGRVAKLLSGVWTSSRRLSPSWSSRTISASASATPKLSTKSPAAASPATASPGTAVSTGRVIQRSGPVAGEAAAAAAAAAKTSGSRAGIIVSSRSIPAAMVRSAPVRWRG